MIIILITSQLNAQPELDKKFAIYSFGEGGNLKMLYDRRQRPQALKEGNEKTEDLKKQLRAHVRKNISPIATPEYIQFADALLKTRSGKIMRRILRKIATGKTDEIGDTSTLADPKVVKVLTEGRIPENKT